MFVNSEQEARKREDMLGARRYWDDVRARREAEERRAKVLLMERQARNRLIMATYLWLEEQAERRKQLLLLCEPRG